MQKNAHSSVRINRHKRPYFSLSYCCFRGVLELIISATGSMDQSYKLSDGYRKWAAFVEEVRVLLRCTHVTSMAKHN